MARFQRSAKTFKVLLTPPQALSPTRGREERDKRGPGQVDGRGQDGTGKGPRGTGRWGRGEDKTQGQAGRKVGRKADLQPARKQFRQPASACHRTALL